MSCSRSTAIFGQKLKRFLNSKSGYKILDLEIGETWNAGGCWLLAEVLHQLLDVSLFAVWSFVGTTAIQQHVVVEVGADCYVDADGASSEWGLLQKMIRVEGLVRPFVGDFNPARAVEDGILCPAKSVQALRAAVKKLI
jgi:hypothetical protein